MIITYYLIINNNYLLLLKDVNPLLILVYKIS